MSQNRALSSGTIHVVSGTTVTVQPPNDRIVDAFTIGLFFGSIALVIVTGLLAWKTSQLHEATKNLAKDTVDASKLSDQHHQESLSAICIITEVKASRGVNGTCNLEFTVQNVGSGPALGVSPRVVAEGDNFRMGSPHGTFQYSLAAGRERRHKFENISWSFPGEPLAATDDSEPILNILVEIRFLNMFNAWGVGKWTVDPDIGYTIILSFDLPKPQDRFEGAPSGSLFNSE